MFDIDEAIKKLEARKTCMEREASGTDKQCVYSGCDECDLCYAQGTTGEQIESLEYAINTLKQKQWLIEQCQEKIDALEQDISDCPKETMTRFILSTKLGVYKYILELLQAEVEE